MGRDLQRSRGQEPQVVITMPLLEGLDGVNKMSKSLGNYIGITESADNIYGKVLSVSDELMFRYYDLLSDLTSEEIGRLKADMAAGTIHPKDVKKKLARELTSRFYDEIIAQKAEDNFEQVFKKHDLPDDIPTLTMNVAGGEIWLPRLLADAGLVKGTGEARRMIKQNAVSLDGEKVTDVEYTITTMDEVLVKVGKRRFCRVKLVAQE